MKLLALLIVPAALAAQAAAPLPPVAEQLAAAVLPLPEEMRAGAAVMGFKTAGKLEMLKPGTNGMICLALWPSRPDFHVACYHEGLEPFMARGREIRETMGARANVDSIRYKEIADGKLKMPKAGALYSITGKKDAWDSKTLKVAPGTNTLGVVYIPFSTGADIGLSTKPTASGPWVMFPGTAKAHIMLQGKM